MREYKVTYSGVVKTLPPTTSQETTQRTIFSLSFLFNGGILYRITDQWSAGINIATRFVNGLGLFGVEMRRVL